MTTASREPTTMNAADLTLEAEQLEPKRAAAIYHQHGALLVRGLMKPYVAAIQRDIDRTVDESLALLDQAKEGAAGWGTPNGALFISAPEGFHRNVQIMTIPMNYKKSAAFLHSALDSRVLDLAEQIHGPDVELQNDGQCLVKEPAGGHPKHLHQDAAYFEHRHEGPMALLGYCTDTNLENGCLHVVPGSHRFGLLEHEDTFSHLGFSEQTWPWEDALPLEGEAGDAIFFHVNTIHGSKPNHSNERRGVFIHRYRNVHDYVVVSGATVEARKEKEELRDQVSGQDQKGWVVRGFRP
jgi:ectoine hydroxylase-related dioxygenase (phytanoyl-CoA dioxygenase family)